jgi:hypothetical protein
MMYFFAVTIYGVNHPFHLGEDYYTSGNDTLASNRADLISFGVCSFMTTWIFRTRLLKKAFLTNADVSNLFTER